MVAASFPYRLLHVHLLLHLDLLHVLDALLDQLQRGKARAQRGHREQACEKTCGRAP